MGISSVMDTWLLLRDVELGGERNRGLYVLKSRGMNHSNQIREFIMSPRGIELVEVYSGNEGVLTGSARLAQEARDELAAAERAADKERKTLHLNRKRAALHAQIAALQAEFELEEQELLRDLSRVELRDSMLVDQYELMKRRRSAGVTSSAKARQKVK